MTTTLIILAVFALAIYLDRDAWRDAIRKADEGGDVNDRGEK